MTDFIHSVFKSIKRWNQRRDIPGRIIRYAVMSVSAVIIGVMLLVLMVWAGAFGALPDKEELRSVKNPIASEVYSADSVLLGRYYFQERSPVTASEIPANLKNALIATEDVRFYDHHGIDVKSLFRVLVKSILLGDEGAGGGSTLTQQLAKNLYPRKTYAFLSLPVNKIKEFIIAWRLENLYTKEEILLLYLNTIPFGDNTFGIKTAADHFFSKSVSELSVNESAVLVGMLKATHSYNPRLFPERALQRRNIVITQMEKYGYLKPGQGKIFQQKPLRLHINNITRHEGLAPYFRAYLQQELIEWCAQHQREDGTPYSLYTDGLKIYTTIDSRMQQYAEAAMREQMKLLQKRFGDQLNEKTLESLAKSKLRLMPQYRSFKKEGLSDEQILERLDQPVKTRVFTWDGEPEVEISLYDSLKHQLRFLQAGVLAMEPGTSAIKVWVGGIDHTFFQFDHVRESTKRQVGSTIKPLIYAAAIESGVDPCDYISARKTEYTNMEGWTPENTHKDTYEKKYSMEGGLTGSVNTVSVRLLEKTGIYNAIRSIRKMGITSELPAVPSLALGTPSISMMEMVGAYTVLVNDGVYTEPYYLTSVSDRHGKILYQHEKPNSDVVALSAQTAQMIVQMLKHVVSEGTGASLRYKYGIVNDIAGKTGTTQSNADGWFIALMPKLVMGAWVGADDPRIHFNSTALGQGAATALPIVAKFLQHANEDKSLRSTMLATFDPLPEKLLDQLDCPQSKSDRNFFERLFNVKKKTKVTKFKNRKDRNEKL